MIASALLSIAFWLVIAVMLMAGFSPLTVTAVGICTPFIGAVIVSAYLESRAEDGQ